jgi:hypothetical protein
MRSEPSIGQNNIPDACDMMESLNAADGNRAETGQVKRGLGKKVLWLVVVVFRF